MKGIMFRFNQALGGIVKYSVDGGNEWRRAQEWPRVKEFIHSHGLDNENTVFRFNRELGVVQSSPIGSDEWKEVQATPKEIKTLLNLEEMVDFQRSIHEDR